jgi:hypothetical protein
MLEREGEGEREHFFCVEEEVEGDISSSHHMLHEGVAGNKIQQRLLEGSND